MPSFALCFTFIFFGPVELTAFNQASLAFDVYDITGIMAVAMLMAFVAMTLVLALFRGTVFNYLVTAVFALLVCGYLQGNVLNGQMGALTGESIAWASQKQEMLLNFGLWLLVSLTLYFVLYLSKKNWRRLVLFGSALLVVMQAAALVTIYAGADREHKPYLSDKGLNEFGSEKNTIVFLVDMLDYQYIEGILEENPTFFDRLDGFTLYTNATSEFPRTLPAANFMMTGYSQDAWQVSREEYLNNSWSESGERVLSRLSDASYRIGIYSDMGSLFSGEEAAKEYVHNWADGKHVLNPISLVKTLTGLSVYRYAPVVVKPFFLVYTDNVNYAAIRHNGEKADDVIYSIDETEYAPEIENFCIGEETAQFKFIHFIGSHAPYTLKADGTRGNTPTSAVEQTMGSFEIIIRILGRMKELGIYEDSTVVISADHGFSQYTHDTPLKEAVRIGMFYKPAGKSKEPLVYSKASVSLANIPATILKSADQDYADYGTPLDEVAEDTDLPRICYNIVLTEEKETELNIYKVCGDASDFANWTLIEQKKVLYRFY